MPPWRIVACAACGLLRTDPRPTPDELATAYADYPAHHASPPAQHGTGWRRIWLLPPCPMGAVCSNSARHLGVSRGGPNATAAGT